MQPFRRNKIDNRRADFFQLTSDEIEEAHRRLQGERTNRRKPVGRRERNHFWNQIAKHDDDGENGDRGRPLRQFSGKWSAPNENETEHDERNFNQRVAEKEDIEDATRFVAKEVDEFIERGMTLLEPAQLMRPK